MTLRQLHDDSETRFDPLLQAKIIYALFEATEIPMGPDDIIVDPQSNTYSVCPTQVRDYSFASPEILLGGKTTHDRNGNNEDFCFALGMLIYYMWQEPYKDLAIQSHDTLLHIYMKKEDKSPLLSDHDDAFIQALQQKEQTSLHWAVPLTLWDPSQRSAYLGNIEHWLARFDCVAQIEFCYGEQLINIMRIRWPDVFGSDVQIEYYQGDLLIQTKYSKIENRMSVRAGNIIRGQYKVDHEVIIQKQLGKFVYRVPVTRVQP